MAEVEVERLAAGLYRLHSQFSKETSIMITAQDMLTLMDWGQLNIRELEDEARKMNRRAERRKGKS